MQRVRIGLTGLACVFLLVLLAASLFGLAGGDAPTAPVENTVNAAEPPREPLAELGVAPGGQPDDATTNATQPTPAPAR